MSLKLYLHPPSHLQVNVKAKVILQKSQGHNFVRDGTFLLNATYTIADKTASIDLTVWNHDDNYKITIGKWYLFSNVSVHQFQEDTYFHHERH